MEASYALTQAARPLLSKTQKAAKGVTTPFFKEKLFAQLFLADAVSQHPLHHRFSDS